MPLSEHPSGRELAAFADDVLAAIEVLGHQGWRPTRVAAAVTAVARKPEPAPEDEHGCAFAHPSLPGWTFVAPPDRTFIFDYISRTVTVR
jgi:hypothetical protein